MRFKPRNTVMLKKFPKIPTLTLTKHCNAQKIPKNSKIMARPGADSLKLWNFFEHYSVSWVSGLGKVDFFGHYSVL